MTQPHTASLTRGGDLRLNTVFRDVVWPGGLSVRVDSSSQKTDVWTFICVAAPAVFYSSIATLVCSGRMPELDHSLVLRSPLYHQNDLKCYFTWEYRMPAGFYVLFLFL